MRKPITLDSLRRFNRNMGFLHLVQGLLMVYFYFAIDKIGSFKPPIFTNYLTFDEQVGRLVTVTEKVGDIPFAFLVGVFLLLSALAHFIIVTVGNRRYNSDLTKGINAFRWFEYSLSSSIMIVLISTLFGIFDLGELIVIFLLNASMNLFGLLMEQMNQNTDKPRWGAFVYGSIAGLGPWIVIVMHALGNGDPAKTPWFVYAILGSYFVFFNTFPINMILQYKKVGRWANYLYGEKTYIVLSLVAKTVLAWLVFSGVMQPS